MPLKLVPCGFGHGCWVRNNSTAATGAGASVGCVGAPINRGGDMESDSAAGRSGKCESHSGFTGASDRGSRSGDSRTGGHPSEAEHGTMRLNRVIMRYPAAFRARVTRSGVVTAPLAAGRFRRVVSTKDVSVIASSRRV